MSAANKKATKGRKNQVKEASDDEFDDPFGGANNDDEFKMQKDFGFEGDQLDDVRASQ